MVEITNENGVRTQCIPRAAKKKNTCIIIKDNEN